MIKLTQPSSRAVCAISEQLDALLDLKDAVARLFPMAWPALEGCLSAVATLLLKDAANPTALILVGQPASSKTTVLDFFDPQLWPFYRSDKFTSKAFVSHYAGISPRKLGRVDLLPRIRHKVLVTPELAPMFRGRPDDLTEHFSVLTRVLDGQGLMTDSGVHGHRGYSGDYFFVWLGATTPLPRTAWEVMAQLGSRLFFMPMPEEEPTSSEFDDVIRGKYPFDQKVQACRKATSRFLSSFLPDVSAVRSVAWDRELTPDECITSLEHLARLLSCLRGVVPVIGRLPGNRPEFGCPVVEKPFRALSVLFNLARGHALVYSRSYLTLADVAMLEPIALGSCPAHRRTLFLKLLQLGGRITASEAATILEVADETARGYLQEMGRLGLVHPTEEGQAQIFQLASRWRWFLGPDFQRLQATNPSCVF